MAIPIWFLVEIVSARALFPALNVVSFTFAVPNEFMATMC